MCAIRALVFAAFLLGAAPPPASTVAEESPEFAPITPLTIEELYAKRLRFSSGEPIVSIGIMEGQREVTLHAAAPSRVMISEEGLSKTIFTPAKAKVTFRVLETETAEPRFSVVVAHHPHSAFEAAVADVKRWQERSKAGLPARVFETGAVFALSGNVLDTREKLVLLGDFSTRAEADTLAREVAQTPGVEPSVHQQLKTMPRGLIGVYDASGHLMHKATNSIYFGTHDNSAIVVSAVEHSRGYKNHGHEDRSFWGHIYVVIDRFGGLSVVNSIGAERLLNGLVPMEIFANAPAEALKAQAVTARGEIFSKLAQRHFGEPYHLCSEQHCQVYAGAGRELPSTSSAVSATRGLLAFRPRPNKRAPFSLVDSVYSSTCGGFSEDNETVWGGPKRDSLRAKLDGVATDPALAPFAKGLTEKNIGQWLAATPPADCLRSTFARPGTFRWRRTFKRDWLDSFAEKHELGGLEKIEIVGRGRGGRVTSLRLVGSMQTKEIGRELEIRRAFDNLPSGMFVIEQTHVDEGPLETLTFLGGGWGHGVGMCQVGAIGRAERKQTFQQILGHYYNGAQVERIY